MTKNSPFKRTKIVATLGPATSSEEKIIQLIDAGVNAFRLNFSHGTHAEYQQLIQTIKKVRERRNQPVAILQDLSGPKIRVGILKNEPLRLSAGQRVIIDASLQVSDGSVIPTTYSGFASDVKAGGRLLLADGDIELEIEKVQPPRVECLVITGGELTSHKGINYPSGSFKLPAITEKDKEDLAFGLEQDVDLVALSFVKNREDVQLAREICQTSGKQVPLIAKIEKHEAVNQFLDILPEVDAVMVARGDLGVEIPLEEVPQVQKRIIRLANLFGKPVITATQMLRSMVDSPRPTRAEVTDVANAILDGTDALMLSEETAIGKYPIEAVRMMVRIAHTTEESYPYYRDLFGSGMEGVSSIPEAISHTASMLARDLQASVILCPTSSGFTARMLSRFRPDSLILAFTHNESTYHQLAISWGVQPHRLAFETHPERLFEAVVNIAAKKGVLHKKDRYVITAGFPFGMGGATNLIRAGIFGEKL